MQMSLSHFFAFKYLKYNSLVDHVGLWWFPIWSEYMFVPIFPEVSYNTSGTTKVLSQSGLCMSLVSKSQHPKPKPKKKQQHKEILSTTTCWRHGTKITNPMACLWKSKYSWKRIGSSKCWWAHSGGERHCKNGSTAANWSMTPLLQRGRHMPMQSCTWVSSAALFMMAETQKSLTYNHCATVT